MKFWRKKNRISIFHKAVLKCFINYLPIIWCLEFVCCGGCEVKQGWAVKACRSIKQRSGTQNQNHACGHTVCVCVCVQFTIREMSNWLCFDTILLKAVKKQFLVEKWTKKVDKRGENWNSGLRPTQLRSGSRINVSVEAEKPNGQVIYSSLFTEAFGTRAASARADGDFVFTSCIM